MNKEKNNMITKFKELFEGKLNLTDIKIEVDNIDDKLIDKIKQELSIIIYKRKNSPKPIRITEINGYFNNRDFKNINLIYKTYLVICLSNGDKIKAIFSSYREENENNINIKINDKLIYDIDNKKFNNEILIDKLIDKYKESLLKTVKIK